MHIIGYFAAILIGISLGLIGSGGSILTIPVLVYLMQIAVEEATVYSLFVVGASAAVGSVKGAREGLVNYAVAGYFGIPSVVAIFAMRQFVMPALPPILLQTAYLTVSKNLFTMLVFAVLMIAASFSMIRKQQAATEESTEIEKLPIFIKGIIVGVLSGLVGVGGGFLIIPTLVFSAKMPMKNAVATSLSIIAVNALIGFLGSISTTAINWSFLLPFAGFAVAGIIGGQFLAKKISNERLKPIFGWFILAMGVYVLLRELFR
jgi:uncharacterized protein